MSPDWAVKAAETEFGSGAGTDQRWSRERPAPGLNAKSEMPALEICSDFINYWYIKG